jgi:hypothetical protein
MICANTFVHARTGIDAKRLLRRARGVPRVLQRLPCAFQKNPMLRIKDLRLAWRQSEKTGVEQ